MQHNKLLWVVALLLIGLVLAWPVYVRRQAARQSSVVPATSPAHNQSVTDRQRIKLQVGDQTLQVEVVATPQSIIQGLSGRAEIGSDGMLFLLPEATQADFWMRDMQFDLDLVWMYQGKVVGVTPNVPKPPAGAPVSSLPSYPSPQTVDMVLEVKAGDAQRWGLTTGDAVRLLGPAGS